MSEVFGVGFGSLSERDRLVKTAQELEAVVVTQLMSSMRNTVSEGGLFEKSAATDMFQSMLDSELARVTAEKSPFGLADAIVSRLQNQIKEDEPSTELNNSDHESPTRAGEAIPGSPRSWRI